MLSLLHDNSVVMLAQMKFPGYKIRKQTSSAGLESIPGIDGDRVIADAAYVTLNATVTADDAFGGLCTGVGGSCFGNRRAAWSLYQLLNLFLFAGASAIRATVASKRADVSAAAKSADVEEAASPAKSPAVCTWVITRVCFW